MPWLQYTSHGNLHYCTLVVLWIKFELFVMLCALISMLWGVDLYCVISGGLFVCVNYNSFTVCSASGINCLILKSTVTMQRQGVTCNPQCRHHTWFVEVGIHKVTSCTYVCMHMMEVFKCTRFIQTINFSFQKYLY